jgi:pyroglutamyl-peptidase
MVHMEQQPGPLVVVTGFGPFPGVEVNPSGAVALALAGLGPDALGGARVRARVLPVSVARAGDAVDALLAELDDTEPVPPAALLSLGVQREPRFRLELRARARLTSERPDADGQAVAGTRLEGEEERRTTLDLEELAGVLEAAGAGDVHRSDDAGGYVCERVYHHVLGRAAELGVRGLFLHVPPEDAVPAERQVPVVAALVAALAGAEAAG